MSKRRIILSSIIASVSLSIMSLTASLAWYATNDRLSIESLQMTISGDLALRISTSDNLQSFKSEITELDFGSEGTSFYFSPVSTIFQDVWIAEKQSTPTFYDCSYYGASGGGLPNYSKKNSGFFSQKVYLLTDSDYNVGFDINESLFANNEERNLERAQQMFLEHPDWDMSVQEIKQRLDNIIKSLRISILIPDTEHYNFFIIDPTKDPTQKTLFGGLLDNNGNGFYDTYANMNMNENRYEVIYGDVNDRELAVYDEPSNLPVVADKKPAFLSSSFSAVSRGNVHTYNAEDSADNGLIIAEEPSTSLAELNVDNPAFSIPCFRNEPREIILSIYLEGWDLDCINETMGASFITKLSFKLLGRII